MNGNARIVTPAAIVAAATETGAGIAVETAGTNAEAMTTVAGILVASAVAVMTSSPTDGVHRGTTVTAAMTVIATTVVTATTSANSSDKPGKAHRLLPANPRSRRLILLTWCPSLSGSVV